MYALVPSKSYFHTWYEYAFSKHVLLFKFGARPIQQPQQQHESGRNRRKFEKPWSTQKQTTTTTTKNKQQTKTVETAGQL
jgi:hypothetical protein